MMICAAGPHPATIMLSQILRQDTKLHRDHHYPLPSPIPKTTDSAPTPPIITLERVRPN
jgi:hypothetical protein